MTVEPTQSDYYRAAIGMAVADGVHPLTIGEINFIAINGAEFDAALDSHIRLRELVWRHYNP